MTAVACAVFAAPALADTPTNQTPPSVTGVTQQGATLTEQAGTWNGATNVTVQWYDCPDNSGNLSACTASGAPTTPGSTYTLTQNDVGKFILVTETADDGSGNVSDPVSSTPVGPVQPPLQNNTPPEIQGSPQNGQTLTEQPGSWSGAQSVTVQWYDCPASGAAVSSCTANGGPTSPGSSITLTDGDVGQFIVVQETATDFSGNTGQASSTAVGPVGPPENGTPPGITASPDGQTLTEVPGTWTPNASVTVQWYDCPDATGNIGACNPSGAPTEPGSSYTVTRSDRGHYIAVRETASAGGVSFADSAAVAPSTTTLAPPLPNPAVTNQTVTLTATVSSSAPEAQPSGPVTFMNNGAPIGCSNESVSTQQQSETVVCQTSFGASSPQITAAFSPDGSTPPVLGSATTSSPALTVGPDTSITTLDATGTANVGQPTTYTASVTGSHPGPVQPGNGVVEFFDGGQPIPACEQQVLINGGATCTLTYATPGQHSISAAYSGDGNFTASPPSSAQAVNVLAPAAPPPAPPILPGSPPPAPLGTITATMQWTFFFAPSYTRVMALMVNGAKLTNVIVRCAGRGCPFHSRTSNVDARRHCPRHSKHKCTPAGSLNLAPMFGSHHLAVGAQITVAITRTGWVGKYYRFTVRAARGPSVHVSCLAPGATRPGKPC